jgi:hypothetical protein
MLRYFFVLTGLCIGLSNTLAQSLLSSGFQSSEFISLLNLSRNQLDSSVHSSSSAVRTFKLAYSSPEMGLYNQWSLWKSDDKVAVIHVRGTRNKMQSWLENFYSAMVPANGTIVLSGKELKYKLSDDSTALVHAGWLLGMLSLSSDVVQKMRSCYTENIRNFIIMGHSQGGAISFLLRSYLHYLPADSLPQDIHIKTYCSAAPKPGNLYYAYDFEKITAGGWGLRVVNSVDWVPETPFGVQKLNELRPGHPFESMDRLTGNKNRFAGFILKQILNKFKRKTRSTVRAYKTYLGELLGKFVQKQVPGFDYPGYTNSFNYSTAGTPIILTPDSAYYKLYPNNVTNVFLHHGFKQYEFLAKKYDTDRENAKSR